jgi:hypothetical protein
MAKLTNLDVIASHIARTGSISIREAMAEYSLSGGSLTKYISIMRRNGAKVKKVWYVNPISGRRYARYVDYTPFTK